MKAGAAAVAGEIEKDQKHAVNVEQAGGHLSLLCTDCVYYYHVSKFILFFKTILMLIGCVNLLFISHACHDCTCSTDCWGKPYVARSRHIGIVTVSV